jgi:DNA-binding IclR family transcriptional regulator
MNDGSIANVRLVIKTIQILEYLARNSDNGITEIASAIGLHKSTVYRLLNTLCQLGYVKQNPDTDKYDATLAMFELGSMILNRTEVWLQTHQIMEQLAQETKETVHLAVLDNDTLVYLHKIDSTQTLRVDMQSQIGRSAPLHCTGVGKAILANSSKEDVTRILSKNPLTGFTKHTITSRRKFDQELAKIRTAGISIDNEEHETGVCCVAVPIVNNSTKQLAAISIAMPSTRFGEDKIQYYSNLLLTATKKLR